MEIYETILDKYNCPRRIDKSLTNIDQIESIAKFELPIDYRNYLLNYLPFENFIRSEYFHLLDIDNIIETNIAYNVFEYLPNTLIIGGNRNVEFIAIEELEEGNCRIILSPYIGMDKQNHIEIGTSFTNFLVRLDNGQGWFENIG